MKKFFDCKDEKITEKTFSQSLIISVLSIFLCLIALCSMTYAWFTSETESSENIITSGSFNIIEARVTLSNETDIIEPQTEDKEKGAFTYTLSKGTYNVALYLNDASTAKGYCIVKIGGVEKHTEVIVGANTANRDGYEITAPFEFTLVVEEDGTAVEFTQHWGVSATSSLKPGETYSASDWNKISDGSAEETSA